VNLEQHLSFVDKPLLSVWNRDFIELPESRNGLDFPALLHLAEQRSQVFHVLGELFPPAFIWMQCKRGPAQKNEASPAREHAPLSVSYISYHYHEVYTSS